MIRGLSCSVGQVVNLRRIVNPPAARRRFFFNAAMLLCGAANPGCSRLSAGSLRLALSRFRSKERSSASAPQECL